MGSDQFKVIYTGELEDGADVHTVAEKFSRKFKLPLEKALKILQAGREVTLKPQAEHIAAYKMKSALQELGMAMRLERVQLLHSPTIEEDDVTPSPSPAQQPPTAQPASSGLSLEPMDEKSSGADSSESIHPAKSNQPGSMGSGGMLAVNNTVSKADTAQPATVGSVSLRKKDSGKSMGALFRNTGALAVGGVGVLLVLVKKFGLFKLLKIGGVLAAGSMISFGYDPVELCMGNEQCQEVVEDQDEPCWEASGLDDVDWDAISDDQFLALLPKVEREYFGCMRYASGDPVFITPITLQLDVIDNCSIEGVDDCIVTAERQLHSCYRRNDMSRYVSADTIDLYETISNRPAVFKGFYGCFESANGGLLFEHMLSSWDEYYYEG